jgi:hypothetical protein
MAAGAALSGLGLLYWASPSQAQNAPASNIVEELQRRLDAGSASLPYAEDGHGYLAGLLKAFGIPTSSQLLVFSGSSLQFDRINQRKPRALYYQDDISLGSVQDGRLIEIIVTDKTSGVAFYTLETAKAAKPRFERRTGECIICHGFVSRWAPGLMVANYDTGPGGKLLNLDTRNLFRLTDHHTPFEIRYGGWYVTGTTGAMQHRGNVTLDPADPTTLPAGGLNVASLADRIDTRRYLEPGSDIVSLLTLEHQSGVVNLITRINAQYRGLDNKSVVPALRATKADIDASIAALVTYLTFADEVPLPSPVKGTSGFRQVFSKAGPRDGKGRSLREFDLDTRLFRYPLSYMIYSQAFDILQPEAKARVLRGLYDVLSSPNPSGDFAPLKDRERAAAIDILIATKPGLPDYWKPIEAFEP